MSPERDPKVRDDIYDQLSRLEQAVDDVRSAFEELNRWTRSLNCAAHHDAIGRLEQRVEQLEGRPRRPPSSEQQRSPTSQALQAVGHLADSLVEVTDRMAVPQRTLEERVAEVEALQDRIAERPHKAIRRWSETLRQAVIPTIIALAAAGLFSWGRCELRPAAHPAPHVHAQQPAADAAARR